MSGSNSHWLAYFFSVGASLMVKLPWVMSSTIGRPDCWIAACQASMSGPLLLVMPSSLM